MEKKKRNGFGSGIGFIFAAAGSAVGLGNLWSFPYKTGTYGGGAFVFVYIVSVLLLGSVAMIADIYLGKRAQANTITSFKNANKHFGWLGLLSIIIPFFITCYYSVLGGYTVKYALNSFSGNSGIVASFTGNVGEVILYTSIFMVLALIIIMGGVKDGIEKASKVLMPILLFVLVAIVIYCLSLGDGVKDGLNFYILKLNFKELGFKGVLTAMGQAFYSLSVGMGIMISYGSYAGKEVKLGQSVFLICFFDTLVALLAGFAIFPAVYHYQAVSGGDVATSGIMLLFSSMPMVFDSLGGMGKIVSFFFFSMVVIAALTSVISLMEVVTQFVIQKFKMNRKKSTYTVSAIAFAISIPIGISLGLYLNDKQSMLLCGLNWLDFLDTVTNTVLMPLCALGSCIAIGWLIDKKLTPNPMDTFNTLSKDGLNMGFLGKLFAVMVKYITPILILIIEIFGINDLIFVDGKFSVNGLGIVLASLAFLIIIIAVYYLFLANTYTGCNADELEMVSSKPDKEEFVEEE